MATFYNQATLSYNNTSTNSNIVTGELVEVLSATKSSLTNTYKPGDALTYVVTINNSGTAPFTGITLSDNLGAYSFGTQTLVPLTYTSGAIMYYINGVLQPTPTVSGTSPLTLTGLTVPAGGTATIIYEAVPNQYAPLGTNASITNTVTINGDTLYNTVTASHTVNFDTTPELSINKAISPTSVVENGQITYTFTIQNTGATAAETTDNVSITDTFNPILSNLSVTYNSTPWTSPANYTYDTGTGVFTTIPGQITVPAATYSQDAVSGIWSTNPGSSTLVVTGTV